MEAIARWESRSGKHWVDLYEFENGGYFYRAPGQGGNFAASTLDHALAELEKRVQSGYFQPDANKTPMKRVR